MKGVRSVIILILQQGKLRHRKVLVFSYRHRVNSSYKVLSASLELRVFSALQNGVQKDLKSIPKGCLHWLYFLTGHSQAF